MKKFKFRLQTVLDLRQNELEKKQQEMASIIKMLNAQKEELEAIQTRQVQVLNSLTEIYTQETLNINIISESNGFLNKLKTDEKKQEAVIENTNNILRVKQLELKEIYKKVKVLEKLKEKQEDAYYKDFEQKTAKEIDDITTTRYKVS